MDAKKIGGFIAASRRSLGLTQQQLAEQLGVTNRAVSKWETGQGLPDIAMLPALAAALEVTVDALLAGGETERAPAPEAAPPAVPLPGEGPALAVLPRRQPTRQELAAAVLTCRRLPALRLRRMVLTAGGLVLLGLGIWASVQSFFSGGPTAPTTLAALAAGLVLLALAALTPRLRSRLWQDLRRQPACTLYKDVLQWEDGTRLSLVELSRVQRYRDCTVLVWGQGAAPLVVTVPDGTCTDSAAALHRQLADLVPAVCPVGGPLRTARLRQLPLLLALAVAAAVVFPLALTPELGFAGTISPTGTVLMLRRDPETGMVTDLHSGDTFPYPVVGRMKKQWLTGDCCAVTYQTTDGSTHVFLSTYGDRGTGGSYYYVEPLLQGTWRQNEDPLNPGILLRKTPGQEEIWVQPGADSSEYGQTYSQSVQFGTLGVALCDEEGLPHWTVVLGRDYDAADGWDPYGSLVICPVSMEATEAVTLHYYSEEDQDRDLREALGLPSPEEEAEQEELAATPPTFSDKLDCTVRADGVYFTWDGGETYSKALGPDEGIDTLADLEPYVLTNSIGAFLTVEDFKDGQNISLHITHDKGRSWQVVPVESYAGVHALAYRSLGFVDDSFGWIALSTEWTMGTGMGRSFLTTRDGGATWQEGLLPGGSTSSYYITGMSFWDDQVGAATIHSPNESDWPSLCLTAHAGQSWLEPILPWDSMDDATLQQLLDQGVYAPGRLTGITRLEDGSWEVTLAQGANEQQEIVLGADALDGQWTLKEVRDLS